MQCTGDYDVVYEETGSAQGTMMQFRYNCPAVLKPQYPNQGALTSELARVSA